MTNQTDCITEITRETRIGVLCGGLSSEREVSLRSGKNCYEALKRLGYEHVSLIDVDRTVATRLTEAGIEVAYLALHGRYGEDGAIQGLLELMGIPYTGNGIAASAVTMDKDLTKRLLAQAGLPVLPSIVIDLRLGVQQAMASVTYQGTYPVMVKPISEGSSVGMSKVNEPADLQQAVTRAAEFANVVMIEQYIPGKSVTVGVFERGGEPVVTPILELRTKTEWYDEAAKYTEGLTEFVLPAELSDVVTGRIQEDTLRTHQVLGCHGVSRTDYVVDAEGRYYILEVNTIPGMTNLSDLPAQARAIGVSYDELVECILKSAIRA